MDRWIFQILLTMFNGVGNNLDGIVLMDDAFLEFITHGQDTFLFGSNQFLRCNAGSCGYNIGNIFCHDFVIQNFYCILLLSAFSAAASLKDDISSYNFGNFCI